ncbi:acety-l/propionyl-CoA carboxylase subunit alpha [Natronosporangium hydrolyticum]|uniref:Acety-l/propionyl-CoA carboxylase subunit alpha n=1 Tax=Natronosporangium hydrolyticum TaxID=2811111 RepID=A0A895Y9V1_9ACTN|nr:biotin carboxylase N-terminal domain-containing protein [Natronosporangium hydrolyticum]QSB14544.1 acety-l/propionyl-CoA carboxylase subunit alpha [Natronosporangium hydrolyticum]
MLVASRGEAARRVLASCRLVGLETVAVYSDADARAPHIADADWAVHLPGNALTATYRRGDRLLAAARRVDADAVHPGWGLLAADPDFAAAVTDDGRSWLGPPAKLLAALRDEPATTARLAEAGVRVVSRPAAAALTGRRLDVPVIVDHHGTAVALGEYDCTVRRGPELLLAECPSPAVSARLRERLCRAATEAVTALGGTGLITVEFLITPAGDCRVLALRPALPPGLPAIECATGLDLVRLQLLVGEESPLPFRTAPALRGHAITGQLRAQDPAYAWQPTNGRLHRFGFGPVVGAFRPLAGPGLRLDSGVATGEEVGTHYGPELASLTAWAPTRHEATRRLARALTGAHLHGPTTNRELLVRALRHPDFQAATLDTDFLPRHPELLAPLLSVVDSHRLAGLAAALAAAADRRGRARALATIGSGWRNVPSGAQTTVYASPMGTFEIGYRFDRTEELQHWWVRGVDPDEVDLAGLGQPTSRPADRPPVALVSATGERVVLDVAGVLTSYSVHRVGEVSYVDCPDGSVALTELPRYPASVAPAEGWA